MENPLRAGIAGVLCFAWTAGAQAAAAGGLSPMLADATLGQAVSEFIAAGVAFGALGFGLKLLASRWKARQIAAQRAAVDTRGIRSVVVALPTATDATASEFDDVERPKFASVISLVEAQLARQLSNRPREKKRATLHRA